MIQLREYNPKINWIIKQIKITDTKRQEQYQKTKIIQYCLGITYKEAKKAIRYILKRYYKYKKLQDKQFSERLLEYTLQDYIINLKLGISLRFYPIYKLIKVK